MSKLRALLSVYDKTNIELFARGLVTRGFALFSTGGTAKAIRAANLLCQDVSELTGYPEMLGGRVKTLHPKVHGGILATNSVADQADLDKYDIGRFRLICVNLYPFAQTVAKPNVTLPEALEQIDIGGVALLRGAKNYNNGVIVVCDPLDYDVVLKMSSSGQVSEALRLKLAHKAFALTASYDAAIAQYLSSQLPS